MIRTTDKQRGDRGEVLGGRSEEGASGEIVRYRQILEREPSSLVFAALAEAYRRRSMLESAVRVCRKGLRYHPNYASGRVALARAYADGGEIEHALRELSRAVALAPDNLAAQRLLSDIYERKQDPHNLERTLHRILALAPEDDDARERLSLIESKKEKQPAGVTPGRSRQIVTRTLAEIYASQGYDEKAFEIYQQLSWQDPQNPVFHERLADLKGKILSRRGRIKPREAEAGPQLAECVAAGRPERES